MCKTRRSAVMAEEISLKIRESRVMASSFRLENVYL